MLNLFKMYCYKMFRQKSLYIIWVVMFFFELLSIPMSEGSFANLSIEMGGFYIMLVAIFATIFIGGDITSGFIKNYAGSVSNRGQIIAARAATILVQNLLTLAVMFVSLFALGLFCGAETDNLGFLLKYYPCVFLVGLACSFIGLMVTELLRKTVPAMILTIAVGTGVVSQIANMASIVISGGRFDVSRFMVTGAFIQLGTDSVTRDFGAVMLIAACYMILTTIISVYSIQKRDVV